LLLTRVLTAAVLLADFSPRWFCSSGQRFAAVVAAIVAIGGYEWAADRGRGHGRRMDCCACCCSPQAFNSAAATPGSAAWRRVLGGWRAVVAGAWIHTCPVLLPRWASL
jgi:hypothetical protein